MKYSSTNTVFSQNRNTLTSELHLAKQTVSQASSVQQDAPVEAGEGHRPPLPQGQGWEDDEQCKEGDAGKQIDFNLAGPDKSSIKPVLPNGNAGH